MSEQITPNPSVPSQVVANVKFPQVINNLGIIPTSYKDSMSYYECLAWLCKFLEETVIPTVNQNGSAVQELQGLYTELNEYVTHYFDTLDVQQEINNKLDQMTADGTLTAIIANYINPFIEEQNIVINDIQRKVNSVASGSPKPVDSVDDMTDETKTYVLTTDGYWYYYNGEEWTRGGVYQATGVSETDPVIEGINYKLDPLYNKFYNYSDIQESIYPRFNWKTFKCRCFSFNANLFLYYKNILCNGRFSLVY